MTSPPLLPLRLERDHLDALEGLLVLRRAVLFDPLRPASELERLERRAARHWAALGRLGEPARAEAAHRSRSPLAVRVTMGLQAGLRLAPEQVLEALPALAAHARLAVRLAVPLAEALAGAPPGPWLSRLSNDFALAARGPLLLGVSAHRPIGLLALAAASLVPETRAAALTAAGRSAALAPALATGPRSLLPLLERATREGTPLCRALALHARAIAHPPSFAAFVRSLGADSSALLDLPGGALLLGAHGVGQLVELVAARARADTLEPQHVTPLGLTGSGALSTLARLACSSERALAEAAAVGLAHLTGHDAAAPDGLPMRDGDHARDGDRLREGDGAWPIDQARVAQLASRFSHAPADLVLGAPLSAAPTPHEPAPRRWLRALRLGVDERVTLRRELPPGLFDTTLGASVGARLHLGVRRPPQASRHTHTDERSVASQRARASEPSAAPEGLS